MANLRKASQSTSEDDLNQMNLYMRQQPWYEEFFRNQGLDPNKVKLNDQQRGNLTSLASEHGMSLGDRMKFDQAGNMNQKGGFAGMPTWAKIALAAAPVAATAGFGVAGMGPMSFLGAGGGGVGAGGTGAGLAASSGAAQGMSPLLMSGAAGSAGLGSTVAGAAAPVATKAAGGGGMNFKSMFGKLFGKGGIDPTTALLGGLSLFGGDEEDDHKGSFKGTSVDPEKVLRTQLDAIERLSSQIQSRGPARLRLGQMPKGPEPVSIPGLPFQIGGGLGIDPAMPPQNAPEDLYSPISRTAKRREV